MLYSVDFDGVNYELPKYSFEIEDKLKAASVAGNSIKDLYKRKYNLLSELIGRDKIIALIGEFKDADPNEIQIFFDAVLAAYSEPVVERTIANINRQLTGSGLDKLIDMADKVERIRQK